MPACKGSCKCDTYAEHLNGVRFSFKNLPGGVKDNDSRWAKDNDAYQRMRKQGLQPQHVENAAELEQRANEPIEIERHTIFGKDAKKWEAAHKEVKEMSES